MQKVFEVGKSYECADIGFDPITIVRRTDKTVWVHNSYDPHHKWATRIKLDDCGNEYIVDTTAPKRYRSTLMWKSTFEI